MRSCSCPLPTLTAGVLGPTKSGGTRRVTLGSGTAGMIRRHFHAWAARVEPEQDWLFSPSPRRPACITAGALSHRLARLGHSDPATTLRHYSHAIPPDDTDIADELDRLLNDLAPEY